MQEEKTEGIVLRSQDYQERHRIVTLFTPQGLISLIVRQISRKNARLLSLTTPFSHGEYLYKRGRSELLSFCDGTLLDDHLDLRHSLKTLQAAGSLAHALISSQMANKPSPALFALYKCYHKQVPHFTNPETLLASFSLKLLKHEGLLTLAPSCSSCNEPANTIHEGESLCSEHAPPNTPQFTPAEWDLLLQLDQSLHFSTLKALTIPPHLCHKIEALFTSRLLT